MMHEQSRLYDDLPGPTSDGEGAASQRPVSAAGPSGDEEGTLAFEEAFARLEHIVQRLEGGQASLEESLALFEEGVGLARLCRSRLDRAERRIRVLVDGEEGERERRTAAELEKEILGDGDGSR